MRGKFDAPWVEVTNPSPEAMRIERFLVEERDAIKAAGGHPERIAAFDSMIFCIRRGDYRQ